MAFTDLRHILMEVLPSCAVVEQGRILRIQSHLEKIRGHLWALNAVIMDAELRAALKGEGPEVDWVANVSATMVDLEDLLDSIIERQERAAATTDRLSRTFLAGTRVAFRLRVVCKLKKLRRRLNELVDEGSALLHLRKEMLHSVDPCKDEFSAILRDEVVGRDEDMEKVVEILKQQQEKEEETMDPHQNDVPFVIAIYDRDSLDFFGMGKTTLAQMIYHHPWVKQHFQERIWVDMSNFFPFDIIGIAREIARAISSNEEACSHLQSLTNLQEFWVLLDQRLSGKRYLLVLDGLPIFYDCCEEWNQLQRILLRVAGPGSTLVVTTGRDSNEKNMSWLNSTREYHLKALPQDVWMELFMKHALMSRADDEDRLQKTSSANVEMLRRWAREIYNVSAGSPLAARTYGYTFTYSEFSRWQKITGDSSESEEFNEDEGVLLALTFLHHLPTRIGRLILYLQLRGECLDEEDFMNMMFAEGLTPNSTDKMVRLDYLKEKLKDIDSTYFSKIRYSCRRSIGQNAIRIPKQCRHLCLSFRYSNALSFPKALFEENKKLRTLIFLHEEEEEEDTALVIQKSQTTEIPQDMFANLVHLRTLLLRDTRIQHLPRTIGKLKHLRYLNLSHTEIETLPRSVCDLWNLQVLKLAHCEKLETLPTRIYRLWKLKILDLAYCEKLQMLPSTITSLVNLQELYLEGCTWLLQLPEDFNRFKRLAELNIQKCVSLTQMPREIGQLTDLIRLSGYSAYDDNIGISALAELKTLRHLKELRLQGLERVSSSDLMVVQDIKLHERSRLQTLSLMWQWSDYMEAKDVSPEALSQQSLQLQLIEDLEPNPQSLKKLEIVSYVGSKLPRWMTKETDLCLMLTEIRLVNLKRCERLPPLGHLPVLKIIEISGMELISTVDDAFYGKGNGFLRLEQLTFSHMPQLENWIAPVKDGHLRWVEYVTLIECPKFKFWELLEYCRDLSSLEIWLNSGMLLTSKFVEGRYIRVRTLKIVGCQEIGSHNSVSIY